MSLTGSRISELPSKLFFRIGEVAGLVGVEPHVLRYWEREFRSIRPTKSAKGQRVYSRKDVENLLRVRDLLYRDGFTIAGAKKKLQRGGPLPEGLVTAGEPAAAAAIEPAVDAELDDDPAQMTLPLRPAGRRADDVGTNLAVRAKLTALRAEVEGFLGELTGEYDPWKSPTGDDPWKSPTGDAAGPRRRDPRPRHADEA